MNFLSRSLTPPQKKKNDKQSSTDLHTAPLLKKLFFSIVDKIHKKNKQLNTSD